MIEQIQPDDFKHLFEIEQQAHLIPWSFNTLVNNQGEHYLNLKFTEHHQIIAFAICQMVMDEATLFNIAVTPKFQNKGYAKKLLNELINQLKQKNITTLWLEVRASNTIAQQLYSQLGFNQVTVRKHYYPISNSEREDAIVMATYLSV